MFEIRKYALRIGDGAVTILQEPIVRILHIGLQKNYPYMWVIEDTRQHAQKREVKIFCHGTGFPIGFDEMTRHYEGTTIGADYVWHWFSEVSDWWKT